MKQNDRNFLLKRITKKPNAGSPAVTVALKARKAWRKRLGEADYLEMLVEYNSEAMALLVKNEGGWVYAYNNWEHEKMTGFGQKAIYQQSLKTVLGADYYQRYEKNADWCRESGETVIFKGTACWNGEISERQQAVTGRQQYFLFPHRLKNGEIRMVDVHSSPLELDGQQYLFSVITDATEREQNAAALDQERELHKTTMDAIHDDVITTDAAGRISYLNPAAEQACGWQTMEVQGQPFEEILPLCHEYTREPLIGLVAGVLADGQGQEIGEPTLLLKKDQTMIPIETSLAPIRAQNGSISGVVVVFRDITLSREKKRRIEYLSYHDALTGLYNRRFYEQLFSQKELKLAHPMAFVMGDVNGLKLTNDVFGHTIGDLLLQSIAQTIKDTAGPRHRVIRWGGDEFMIVMPGSDLKDAERLVRRIKEQLQAICINGTIEASVFFGMAPKKSRDDEPGAVLKKAEEMMYQIKLLESKSMRGTTINALLAALDEKKAETKAHTMRLSAHVMKLADLLDLNVEAKNRLILLTMLHDIGKVGIPDHILGKPGRLTEAEWQIMQTHSEIGYRIAANVPELHVVTEEILHHHERWDGRGYPAGLSGEKIPLNSRILAIVDAYDVMTHEQLYQPARSHEEAIAELQQQAGRQFDPRLVERFINQVSHW